MANNISLKPAFIIVAGPNGSGKKTITEYLLRHQWFEGCEYINPDTIAQSKFNGWDDDESIINAANYAKDLKKLVYSFKKKLCRRNRVFTRI